MVIVEQKLHTLIVVIVFWLRFLGTEKLERWMRGVLVTRRRTETMRYERWWWKMCINIHLHAIEFEFEFQNCLGGRKQEKGSSPVPYPFFWISKFTTSSHLSFPFCPSTSTLQSNHLISSVQISLFLMSISNYAHTFLFNFN